MCDSMIELEEKPIGPALRAGPVWDQHPEFLRSKCARSAGGADAEGVPPQRYSDRVAGQRLYLDLRDRRCSSGTRGRYLEPQEAARSRRNSVDIVNGFSRF